MPFPAVLLRCLLALALVAGGVPTYAMAGAQAMDEAAAQPGCHGTPMQHDDSMAASSADADADCCGSAGCLCDCLHHMPGVVFAAPPLAAPAFAASAPASLVLPHYVHLPATSLRPPIG